MPGRAGWQRYTKEQVLAAIGDSAGIVSAIAQRLGCDWNTARRYVDRWEETRRAFQAERERVLDLAETTIIRAIREGDTGTAKWLLSRLGRHRGYGDAVDLSASLPLQIVLRWPDDGGDGETS